MHPRQVGDRADLRQQDPEVEARIEGRVEIRQDVLRPDEVEMELCPPADVPARIVGEGSGGNRAQQEHQGGAVLAARRQDDAQDDVQDEAVRSQQYCQEKAQNRQPHPLRKQRGDTRHAGEGEDRVRRHHAGEAAETEQQDDRKPGQGRDAVETPGAVDEQRQDPEGADKADQHDRPYRLQRQRDRPQNDDVAVLDLVERQLADQGARVEMLRFGIAGTGGEVGQRGGREVRLHRAPASLVQGNHVDRAVGRDRGGLEHGHRVADDIPVERRAGHREEDEIETDENGQDGGDEAPALPFGERGHHEFFSPLHALCAAD